VGLKGLLKGLQTSDIYRNLDIGVRRFLAYVQSFLLVHALDGGNGYLQMILLVVPY